MSETANNLSRSEHDDLIVMFQQFDTQQRGTISLLELKSVLEQVAHEEVSKRPALEKVLASAAFQQSDQDKQITQEEFIQLLTNDNCETEEQSDEMRRLFGLFDVDNKGYITVDDLRRIADELGECMGEEELEEMIQRATSTSQPGVTLEDFEAVMHHKLMA
eukprot:scaffold16330_cov172-Amphora_coffeaeformis.AAC.12